MKKLFAGLLLFGAMYFCCDVVRAEPPNYSWNDELKADIGRDGRSWNKGYFGSSLIFEGSTSDGSETTFSIINPTRDNLYTFPDGTGTVKLSNIVSHYFGSSSAWTLDTNECQASILRGYGTNTTCTATGTFTAGHVFIVLNNNTAGTLTVKSSGGTGTAVFYGSATVCYANGTNTDIARISGL